MPTLEQNLRKWNADYEWLERGEEWSATWGGSQAQWGASIFPRIQAFMPAETILEIAPGFGRWTNYLRRHCHSIDIVDLAENCINICRKRFADDSKVRCHTNDGKSLAMINDDSVDFVFSFDSLVHAEADVIATYVEQLATKLRADGVGFIHHSNLGEYRKTFRRFERIPERFRATLIRNGIVDDDRWRALSMTARKFSDYCDTAGLKCIGQELVNWGTKRPIDCFSLFTRKGSKWARENRVYVNTGFMDEARAIKLFSRIYTATPAAQA